MNRTVWIAVAVTALIFLLTSLLPLGGLHPEEASELWSEEGAGAGSLWNRISPYLGSDLGTLGWILLGTAGALLLIVVVHLLWRGPAKERRRARRLVGRGRPLAEVARRMGLSQDAVRTLLEPAPARRTRSGGVGRFFRSANFSPPGERSGGVPADDGTSNF